ncbi:MAG: phosphatase PAP2 family protein [Actinophytocola sp.]|nr:phosphatase PAP2 family protein [Actinophytocola sp.]
MRRPFFVLGVLALLGFGVLALRYAGTGTPGRVDRWTLDAMGGTIFTPSPARTVALVIDRAGEPDGAVALVGVLVVACLLARRWRLAVLALAGPGLAVLASTALKPLVGRTVATGELAFPSGHTAFLTAVALVAGLLIVAALRLGRDIGLLVVLGSVAVAGAAMSWAQTVLFSHYPTDTLGGFLLALAVVPSLARVIDRDFSVIRA